MIKSNLPILIIDDEKDILDLYEKILYDAGIDEIIKCSDSHNALSILLNNNISLIILDLGLPDISGEELLMKIKENYPNIPVIVITESSRIDTVVNCIKNGAFNYMVKPIDSSRLINSINSALKISKVQENSTQLDKQNIRTGIKNPEFFTEVITNNDKMKSIFKYIEAIAKSPKPVLINGESGTGKELIARIIHKCSMRAGGIYCR